MRQFRHFVAVATVNTNLAVALFIFSQANGDFTLFALQASVQHERLLLMANHPANLQAAKRPTVAERIDGLEHTGFAAAVGANQKVKAGR